MHWLGWLLLATATAQGAALDEEFLAARDAYQSSDAVRLEKHVQALEGHLLAGYVAYWRLSLRLEAATPEEVHGFLDANRDGPLAQRLRSKQESVRRRMS